MAKYAVSFAVCQRKIDVKNRRNVTKFLIRCKNFTTMRNLEQELKLRLTEREYNLVAAATEAQPILHVNHYFAAEDMSPDTMVRLRQTGDRYVMCYKRRISHSDNVMVCDEREVEATPEFAQQVIKDGIGYRTLRQMFDVADFDTKLDYVGALQTYRTTFSLAGMTVELDKCEYLGAADYELECESTHVDELDVLKNYLNNTFGIVARASEPKNKRFFDRLKQLKQHTTDKQTD